MNNTEQGNESNNLLEQSPSSLSTNDVDIIKRYFRRTFKVSSPNVKAGLLVQHITLVNDMLLDNIFNRINTFPSGSIEIKKRFDSGKYFLNKITVSSVAYILALINITNQILNKKPIQSSSVESFLTYTSINPHDYGVVVTQYNHCVQDASQYLNEQIIFNKKSDGSDYIAADNFLTAITAGNIKKENNINLPNLRFTMLTATLTVIAVWRNDKKTFDYLADALENIDTLPPIGNLIIT